MPSSTQDQRIEVVGGSLASVMAIPGVGGAFGAVEKDEDASRKVRKPYTISKSRESWSEQEHDKFLEALQLNDGRLKLEESNTNGRLRRFDRDWKKIEAFVGSKTVIQIRSHAQKYFLKVQKNGMTEHVPPPRPKRKAAHPYPQKACKTAAQLSQAAAVNASCMVATADTSSVIRSTSTTAGMSSGVHSSVQPVSASNIRKVDDVGPNCRVMVTNNCCSSSTGSPSRASTCERMDLENNFTMIRVMPDFAQVYSFLGSVFDPNTTGHLEKLNEMNPIDVEAVVLLMRNLSINLTSPDFEDHRKLFSTYDGGGTESLKYGGCNVFQSSEPMRMPFMVKGE